VGVLIEKYNLDDPIISDEIGLFTNQELGELYKDLINKGNQSLQSALEVGATIEDLDIYDLEKAMEETSNEDIVKVYTNLRNGSENHMRAFVKQLESNGGTYEAQYISSERLMEILSGENKNKAKHNQPQNNNMDDKQNYLNEVRVKSVDLEEPSFFTRV
jgi:hypothetical protein